MLDGSAGGVLQVEFQTAELSALTAVCRTPEAVLRCIAHSRVAHAEGSMDEDLEFHVGNSLVDFGNLVGRQLTGKHGTLKAKALEPAHLPGCAGVALCACVKAYR